MVVNLDSDRGFAAVDSANPYDVNLLDHKGRIISALYIFI
jgi:hypothetical protein